MLKSYASTILSGFAALLFLTASSAALAQTDAAAVQQQLFDALAHGDVGQAVALFTDDAIIDAESGQCAATPCVGKDAIRKDFERYVMDKSRHVKTLSTYVTGNVLVTRFEASSATIKKAGVDRVILWGIREMRGDKIATTRCCLPERTDSQTQRFLDWDYAHPTGE
jgi:hypothetical protein